MEGVALEIGSSWAFAFDVGGTSLKYGLVSAAGELVGFSSIPVLRHDRPSSLKLTLDRALGFMQEEAARRCLEVRAVGVGCPGTVDASGAMRGALPNLPHLRGFRIVAFLRERTELPVYADNDANLMAFAEASVGAGRGHDAVLGITVGTGIGSGMVISRRIYRGAGHARELGHVRLVPRGRPCPCGGRGCLERYASGPALSRAYAARVETWCEVEDVLNRATAGDHDARAAVRSWASSLGRGIGLALTLFDPDCVVLGGGVFEAPGAPFELVVAAARRSCLATIGERARIVKAGLGNRAGVVGAGLAALERIGLPI